MRQFDSYTVDELREIVDPDRPETLQEQSEGWGDMAVLLQEYSLLLEQRLKMVEESWTGDAAKLYFDEVRRVQRYIDESAERATTNSVLWCTVALMAGIAKHDVSHIHKLWKNLDGVTDAVGLGFLLEAVGLDKTVENLKRMPYDEASRQIMETTMAVAEESYSQMREFEEFTPPPSADDSGPQLQSGYSGIPAGATTIPAPPTTVAPAATPPLPMMGMRSVVSPVIGARPGMYPAQPAVRAPGATVRPVIGQRGSASGAARPTGRLIGRYGVVSATPDVDLRDPNASRARFGGGDVNRGLIANDDRPTSAESRLKLEEEVLRLRERAYAHRAEALSPEHSQHALPGIIGNDATWGKASHDPGPVLFENQRRRHDPGGGWDVF